MAKTDEVKRVLDGVTFRGRVPVVARPEHPDLADIFDRFGDLTDLRDLEQFDHKIIRQIRALALCGPETFNFCRRYAELGVQQLADLLDVDRRTVSRWEHGEVQIPKPVMAIVALLADEHSRGKSRLIDQLSFTPKKRVRTVDVDAA